MDALKILDIVQKETKKKNTEIIWHHKNVNIFLASN